MALENETPAKKAGVEEIKRKNTWLNLLESSIKKVNSQTTYILPTNLAHTWEDSQGGIYLNNIMPP